MTKKHHILPEQLEAEIRRANEAIVDMKLAIVACDEAQRHVDRLRKEIVTLTQLLAESQHERELLKDRLKSLEGTRA